MEVHEALLKKTRWRVIQIFNLKHFYRICLERFPINVYFFYVYLHEKLFMFVLNNLIILGENKRELVH